MNDKKHTKVTNWYSNENLAWIWGRSISAAAIGLAVLLLIGLKENMNLLFAVVGVPLMLGIGNTFSYIKIKKTAP